MVRAVDPQRPLGERQVEQRAVVARGAPGWERQRQSALHGPSAMRSRPAQRPGAGPRCPSIASKRRRDASDQPGTSSAKRPSGSTRRVRGTVTSSLV
jgi:hypothetical protein